MHAAEGLIEVAATAKQPKTLQKLASKIIHQTKFSALLLQIHIESYKVDNHKIAFI